MINNSVWICVEGIDGAGKSTQVKKIDAYYNNNGVPCFSSHVFETKYGMMIKRMFLENNSFSDLDEILLLMLSRNLYIENIEAEKDKFNLIITDRMFMSIEAMQGYTKKNYELCKFLKKQILAGRNPDMILLIDTDVKIAKTRKKAAGNVLDRIENKSIEFHEKIRKRFIELAQFEQTIKIVNGNLNEDEVFEQIIHEINSLLIEKKWRKDDECKKNLYPM